MMVEWAYKRIKLTVGTGAAMEVLDQGYRSSSPEFDCREAHEKHLFLCRQVLRRNALAMEAFPANQFTAVELERALWGFSYIFWTTGAFFLRRMVNDSVEGIERRPPSFDAMYIERLLRESTFVIDVRRERDISIPRFPFLDILNLPRDMISHDLLNPDTPYKYVTMAGIDYYINFFNSNFKKC